MLPELLAKSLAPLKNTAYLRSDVLKVLEKTLVPLYRQHGYLKFAIASVKPTLGENNFIDVEVAVSEGDQYRLGAYSWSGNTLITSEELSKRITLKAGDPLNAVQLERDLVQTKKLFGKFGHEGVIIDSVPEFSAGTVSYNFQVKEGELYHMGKLEIEGIDPEQIRRLAQGWKLGEGEPYDSTYVTEFVKHTVLKVPGRKWEWMTFEQIDDAQKTVNVRLQVKIE
jgi:outer membrane protein insertion porin family